MEKGGDPMKGLAAGEARDIQGFRAQEVLRAHRAFAGIVTAYCLAALAVGWLVSDNLVSLALYNKSFLIVMLAAVLAFFLGHAVYTMVVVRPEALIRHILTDLKETYLTPKRLLSGLTVVLLLPLFISAFTAFKSMIPIIQPFSWDPAFAAWDRAIHGGVEPWRLLQPVLGRPLLTSALNTVYHAWFFVMFAVVFWQAFSLSRPRLRMRFLLSYLLVWIAVGTLAATLLSSAGPVYYHLVEGAEGGFRGLLAYLETADTQFPVLALEVQQTLWQRYSEGGAAMGSGISAMPSLHVAMAFLFALLAWRVNRLLGACFYVFTALILLGSVHLAWHYAVDGYLALVLTWCIWHLVDRFLEPAASLAADQ